MSGEYKEGRESQEKDQDPDLPVFNRHRGELHTVVFNHAKDDLGIPIHLGKRVKQYFEEKDEAGIVLESGEEVSLSVGKGSLSSC